MQSAFLKGFTDKQQKPYSMPKGTKFERGKCYMKEYHNPHDLIADSHAAVLDILTDDERDYLCSALDYEPIVLRVHDGIVDIVDSISDDVLNTEPFFQFVRESILFALEDCKK
jgi:hypothetical protein